MKGQVNILYKDRYPQQSVLYCIGEYQYMYKIV